MTERQMRIEDDYEEMFGLGKSPAYNWLKPDLIPEKIFELMQEAVKTGIELKREDIYPDWVLNPDPNKIY
ncbi:MAG: hypothetical protein SPD11_09250 [Sphaerochaetaceae bacterium]|nr:hypothetical protein [Sphaerochaetaceae bacterium]